MMDLKDTAKQIGEILLLLLEGGFAMPIILTSIDRYGSLVVAEYTPRPGEKRRDYAICWLRLIAYANVTRTNPSWWSYVARSRACHAKLTQALARRLRETAYPLKSLVSPVGIEPTTT